MLFKTLLVIILSVSGVLSKREWGVTYAPERICALKGSSVDMRCTYFLSFHSSPTYYTVQNKFWFIYDRNSKREGGDLSQDRNYSHRVEYLGNQKNDSTFRINQLRESDSGTYKCRFLTDRGTYTGEPGVTLEVTDVQLMVNPDSVTEGQNVSLICNTTCTLTGSPAFIWYRNGSPLSITEQTHQFRASSEDRSRYTCAVKGYEHLRSPAVALNVRYNASALLVTVQGGQSLIAAAAAVGVAAILALVFLGVLCVRRRKSTSETEGGRQGIRSPIYGNVSGMAVNHTRTQGADRDDGEIPLYSTVQPASTRNQDHVLYSTVQPTSNRNQEQVLYSTVQPASTRNQEQVLYSTVQPASTRNQEQVLYSTVKPASTRNQGQVLYSTVKPASTRNQEQVLYSTVQPASTRNQKQVLYSTGQPAGIKFPSPVLHPGHQHHQ